MKKTVFAGALLCMALNATAQSDNLDIRKIYTEAGLQGVCSALKDLAPVKASDVKISVQLRKNLVSCAWFDEQQARKRAGMQPETFEAWSSRHPLLARKDVPDQIWIDAYHQFLRQLSAYPRTDSTKPAGEKE